MNKEQVNDIRIRLTELRKDLAAAMLQVSPIKSEMDKLEYQLLEMASDFKVGDIISWRGGKRKGRVLKIRRWIYDSPEWLVKSILKDGTEGEELIVRPWWKPVKIIP